MFQTLVDRGELSKSSPFVGGYLFLFSSCSSVQGREMNSTEKITWSWVAIIKKLAAETRTRFRKERERENEKRNWIEVAIKLSAEIALHSWDMSRVALFGWSRKHPKSAPCETVLAWCVVFLARTSQFLLSRLYNHRRSFGVFITRSRERLQFARVQKVVATKCEEEQREGIWSVMAISSNILSN